MSVRLSPSNYLFSTQPAKDPRTELQALEKEKSLLQENQTDFMRLIRYRSCMASTTVCLLCPCTGLATLIPFLLCYPCICYQILTRETNCFDSALKTMGCALDRPPENRWEYCCIYCTPCYLDLPDERQANGSDYYSLPSERAEERARTNQLLQIIDRISSLKQRTFIGQHYAFSSAQSTIPLQEEMT